MKSRRINSFHCFARLSFILKSENAKGYNKIEKKKNWLFDIAGCIPKCGISLFSYFPVDEQNRVHIFLYMDRIVDSMILSIHGKN